MSLSLSPVPTAHCSGEVVVLSVGHSCTFGGRAAFAFLEGYYQVDSVVAER